MSDSPRPRNTSQAAPRATDAEWQAARLAVLERLDIREEYEALGVRFLPRSPSGGWLACYAIDVPHEKTPGSAAVKVSGENIGLYNDKAHTFLKMGLFDFAAKYGNFPTWFDALKFYARKVGVVLPSGGSAGRQPSRPLAPPQPKKKSRPKRCEDIGSTLLAYHRRAAASGELDTLAARLRVHREGLDACGVGVSRPGDDSEYTLDSRGYCSLHPECRLIEGKIVIVSADRRGKGKTKKAMNDRVRGIYAPLGWVQRVSKTGYLFIVEGATDIEALTSMGLGALGLPSAKGNVPELVEIAAFAQAQGMLPADVRIICMVDVDGGAGAAGMTATSQDLADALQRPIYRRYVPYAIRDGEVRSWSPKDSRDYLGAMIDDPHLATADVRYAVGRQFADHTFHGVNGNGVYSEWNYRVTHPTPPDSRQVQEGPAVTSDVVPVSADTVQESDATLTLKTEEAAEDPSKEIKCRTPIKDLKYATVADDLDAFGAFLGPLAALPRKETCPKPCRVPLAKKSRQTEGAGVRVPCDCWNCEACCHRRKFEWGINLASHFRDPATLPTDFWRGPVRDLDRIRKKVNLKSGEYCRILIPGGLAVVIATVDFPGSTAIDLPTAIQEMVTAVVSVEYKPPKKGTRVRPIAASYAWGLPPKPRAGTWVGLGERFKKPEESHPVYEAMGVLVRYGDKPRSLYQFPPAWRPVDTKRATWWASIPMYPDGYIPGTSPVPDPAPLSAALSALPADPPPPPPPPPPAPKLTARQRKEAARLAKFAATPGLFGPP